jgi:hypothetical protein
VRVPVDGFSDGFDPESQASLEATADIELAHSMAPAATLKVIQQSRNIAAHYEVGLNTVAADDSISIVSDSVAFRADDAEVDTVQFSLARGVSFLAASGDTGADERTDELIPDYQRPVDMTAPGRESRRVRPEVPRAHQHAVRWYSDGQSRYRERAIDVGARSE